MDQKTALTVLLVALVLSVGVTAVSASSDVQPAFIELQQQPESLEKLAVSVPLVFGAGLHNNSNIVDQPTRMEIYSYIQNNPGIHFRGICDGLSLPVGVVQYHLYVLERSGYITSIIDGQNKRFFQADTFTQQDIALISIARHETAA